MKIGILGTGKIANVMAKTMELMEDAELIAVASRSKEKAEDFAFDYDLDLEKAYGSYEELAADPDVELVYIATPHSRHYEDTMLMLKGGKHVLCEKAFMANASQAREVISYAKSHGLLVQEALWTRFQPMTAILKDVLASGVLGEMSSLTANFGADLRHVDRLMKPELAGGALLDLGLYSLNFALTAFGSEGIEKITSTCTKNEYGVDLHNSIILTYTDGRTAILHSNAGALLDNRAVVYGSQGRLEFESINNSAGMLVCAKGGAIKCYNAPKQITGFEYEVQAVIDAIEEGKLECEQMPHSETIRLMEIMDELRAQWGIKYPFE